LCFNNSAEEEEKLTGNQTDQGENPSAINKKLSTWILTLMETVAFAIQIVLLILIPVLLNSEECSIAVHALILIPITLIFLSIVWSGWITAWFQKHRMPIWEGESDENKINGNKNISDDDGNRDNDLSSDDDCCSNDNGSGGGNSSSDDNCSSGDNSNSDDKREKSNDDRLKAGN